METNLVLNWKKCHFMVEHGIVLGHVISSRGIEVDKSKIDIMHSLPPPTNVKEVCSFLGHAGFIGDLSRTSQKSQYLFASCYKKMWNSTLMINAKRHLKY